MARILIGCAGLAALRPITILSGGGGVIGPCAGSSFTQCGPGGGAAAPPALPTPQIRRTTVNPNMLAADREPIERTNNAEPQSATVLFDYDSSTISQSERDKITRFAVSAQQARVPTVFATGFASTEGDEEYNLALGQRRADAVAGELRSQGYTGVVTATTRGESSPVMGANGQEDRALSRRVTLTTVAPPTDDGGGGPSPTDPGIV